MLHHRHATSPIIMDAGTRCTMLANVMPDIGPSCWIAATERHDAQRLGMVQGPAAGITDELSCR